MSTQPTARANKLITESSPYLLQHAHNPVDWYPWGEEALTKARTEDKPMIVSIGYSACHWCHVMERESFENEQIARIMNEYFVCVKVDREERPDVDAIYMDAVQTMGVQGGWPLNVFLTAAAKPFYGGTYFPPRQWAQMLLNIAEAYRDHKDQLVESAEQFTQSIAVSDSHKYGLKAVSESNYTEKDLHAMFRKLAAKFDKVHGGMSRAPKFPMPSIYLFLLRYHQITNNQDALNQITLTLDRMAMGGIYDQIGGGFARYSVDGEWFAPHFEKMLYDNGQLLSVYAEAYCATKRNLYREVVYQTIDFVQRELTSDEGGFYSALDADSEGVEGKFYAWTYDEWEAAIRKLTLPDGISLEVLQEYYGVTTSGNWEHGRNILHRPTDADTFAQTHQLENATIKTAVRQLNEHLFTVRSPRIRPGLDDKILASWNGLMLRGLVDAYQVFGEPRFLEMALRNAQFIRGKMKRGNQVYHSYKNGRATITGYLEDYALVMDAYAALYQATFDEQWLTEAAALMDYAMTHFYHADEQLFYFTDDQGEALIARKKELFDNVIPASNSVMAKNLYVLGLLLDRRDYTELSDQMLARVKKLIVSEPQYLTNWATLVTARVQSTAEIAIVGAEADAFRQEFQMRYLPNKMMAGTTRPSELPLLRNRTAIGGRTTVYVCYNKACQLPVFSVGEAIDQIAATTNVRPEAG